MKSLIFSALALSVFSCNDAPFFVGDGEVPDDGWAYTDTIIYQVDISDTTIHLDIGLNILHSSEFEYQNLYIQILTNFPDGKTLSQTLPLDFADHTGRWYGDCGKSSCKLFVILQENALFNQIGMHTFKIVQYMRVDPVIGISAVDLILDRHEI